MKFNKRVGSNNRVGRHFSKCDKCIGIFLDAVSKNFNLETNKRMKIHEKKCIIEAIVTKKGFKKH